MKKKSCQLKAGLYGSVVVLKSRDDFDSMADSFQKNDWLPELIVVDDREINFEGGSLDFETQEISRKTAPRWPGTYSFYKTAKKGMLPPETDITAVLKVNKVWELGTAGCPPAD